MTSGARFHPDVADIFVRPRESALVNGLVWISIVMGVVGSILLTAWSVVAAPLRAPPKSSQTRSTLIALRQAAEIDRAEHPDAPSLCPTPRDLRDAKEISSTAILVDAWGKPVVIRCEGDETTAVSAGPDGHFGTADDMVAPEAPVQR